jgi:hypothetical protein
MPSSKAIDPRIQETLNDKRKVYSRKGKDNPYTSRSKDAKKKYLKTIQKTPYLYMLSMKSIQEDRSDTAQILKNMKANKNTTGKYTQTDMGYSSGSYSIEDNKTTTEATKYYTKGYSTNNKEYLNYWKPGPVLLSNTELSEDVGKKIKFGMGMYESRGKNAENYGRKWRPNAGVKGLSSEYHSSGQQAFVRKVTVNWTCFDLEDLDYLQDRFMTLGRKVYVEWGWANQDMIKTPVFLKEESGKYVANPAIINDKQVFSKEEGEEELVIQTSAAKNLKEAVLEQGKGNFDAIMGFVEGFDFSQREDGGFDCTTNLVVNGGNIFNIPKDKQEAAESEYTTAKQKEDSKNSFKEDISSLHKILDYYLSEKSTAEAQLEIYKDYTTADKVTTSVEERRLRRDLRTTSAEGIKQQSSKYRFDGNAVIKEDRLKQYDSYSKTGKWSPGNNNTTEDAQLAGATHQLGRIQVKSMRPWKDEKIDVVPAQCWVRWGWFEDNILNKHFGIVDAESGDIVAAHRSIVERSNEEIEAGMPRYDYELCSNHKHFQTTDINTYIFPGQFSLTKMSAFEAKRQYKIPEDKKAHLLYQAHYNYLASRKLDALSYTSGDTEQTQEYGRKTINDLQQILEDHQLTPGNLNLQETGIVPYLELVQLSRVFSMLDSEVTITKKSSVSNTIKSMEGVGTTTKEYSFVHKYPNPKKEYGIYYNPNKGRIRNIFINVAKLQDIFSTPSDTIKENFNLFSNSLYNETNGLINIKLEIKDDGGTTLKDKNQTDEDELLEILKKKQVYEFPVHTNDSFVESQELSSDIGSKLSQILISKQYASQAVKDDKGNLIAQAVFDGITDNKKIVEVDSGKVHSAIPTPTASPAWLALNGGDEFANYASFGIIDADENKDFDATKEGIDTSNLPPTDYDEEVTWERGDDVEADAEQASKYWEELDLDYTITGKLKKDKRKEMFKLINKKELEEGQIKGNDGTVYEISNITEDKFGLLFITNTLEMTGIAGIKPGDVWTTSYLPAKFKDNAHFWTTNVTQTIDSSGWKTTITGRANMQFEEVE